MRASVQPSRSNSSSLISARRRTAFFASCLLALTTVAYASDAPRDLVVHEWGTFTSVQGGDGVPLKWSAQQIGDLPRFVHNWLKPELGRQPRTELFFGKAGLSGLQRMETPVIYFYSEREFIADVEVGFPKGLITEWYPQANRIGPTTLQTNAARALARHGASKSLIHWQNLRVSPAQIGDASVPALPMDTQGAHYFAARETGAGIVTGDPAVAKDERDKFLFYRGTGSFGTPLVVSTSPDGLVTLRNTGDKPLANLFLLHVENGRAEWAQLDQIAAGARQHWRAFNSTPVDQRKSVATVQKEIGEAMAQALTATGLYPAEATAMVKTWNDAWFGEEGVRVLYLLPRAWTDEILPLKLSPKPRELVRVMVGRAEIIPPQLQRELALLVKLSNDGDAQAKERLQAHYQKLGRFAGPAYQLANDLLKQQENKPVVTAKVN